MFERNIEKELTRWANDKSSILYDGGIAQNS